MKKITLFLFFFLPFLSFGQFGVGYFQSNVPYVGFNYEINERIKPEIRIGTDRYFSDFTLEADVTYDILNKADYEFYAGLGYITNYNEGFVIPLGLNIFPFEKKDFGFLIEVSPIIGDDSILRGSLGIRYRFTKG